MEISDRLAQYIRTPILLVTAIFTLVVIFCMMLQNRKNIEDITTHLQKNHTEEQRKELRTQVEQFSLHARHQSTHFYKKVAADLQEDLDTAIDIAQGIYQNNKKKEEEIITLISASLRNIRLNKGRKSYFIYTPQGKAIMMPDDPTQEGLLLWDKKDKKGNYFVQELIKSAQQREREVLYWSLQSPYGSAEKTVQKIGMATYFADCDIIIGIADYANILQEQLHQQILEWVWQRLTPHYNRLFIFDYKENEILVEPLLPMSDQLLHIFKSTASSIEDSNNLQSAGDFISSNDDEHDAEMFIKTLPEWGWVAGAIRKRTGSNDQISNRIALIKQQGRADSLQIILGCLIFMGLIAWLAFYLSRQVSEGVYKKIMFDHLTGLPNRNSFLLQIQAEIRMGKTLVILDVDIDDFSALNERFDRQTGDRLFCEIVERLKRVTDSSSHLCRVTGDEFLLYFKRNIPCELGEVDVSHEITAVREALQDPFLVAGEKIQITSCIGAIYTGGFRSSANELLRKANIMLFRAKNEGRNCYSCYNSSVEKVLQRDMLVAKSLVTALANDEINVVYQPQIDSVSGKISAVEALCRWSNEELGFISPDEFIPVAEKSGFILPLGNHVFRKACKDIFQWIGNEEDAIKVSINISPRQLLHSNFIQEIQKIIKEVGINPERVTLEITENLLITDVEAVTPVLRKLDLIGFDISLDDFGTGASSLTHLHHLPIKELKIDRSFVMNMFENAEVRSLIKSIIAVGKSNKLQIVAEGVETQEHANWLRKHNCDLLQGYFYSKPISISELKEKYPQLDQKGN